MKTGRLDDTMGNLQAEALVKTLAYTLVVVKSKTLCDTRDDVQAEALVNTLADTIPEVKAETVAMWRPRNCSTRWLTPQKKVYAETLAHTLGDVDAEALVLTLNDKVPKVKAETLNDTPSDTTVETLFDTLATRYSWRSRLFAIDWAI